METVGIVKTGQLIFNGIDYEKECFYCWYYVVVTNDIDVANDYNGED